jgi:uncharacterized protein (DUF849 family)
MVQVALNGSRFKTDHPHIPTTTEQLCKSARESVNAGAKSVHFHVRDPVGNETLESQFVSIQITGIKTALPDIPLGISTGEWIEPAISKRISLIKKWDVLPDFASVNGHEAGFELIINELLNKGVGIEAGISDIQAAMNYKKSGLLKFCFRILLEPAEQELEKALKNLESIENSLSDSLDEQSILLHGYNKTCWELLKIAGQKEYDCRIGFEDVLTLPTSVLATSNEELVKEASALLGK